MPALRIHGTSIDSRTTYSVPPERCAAAPPRVRTERDRQPARGGETPLPPGRRPSDADRRVSTNAANNRLPAPRKHFQG
jgi:hypothetical protein